MTISSKCPEVLHLGASVIGNQVRFSFSSTATDCGLILYSGSDSKKIPFSPASKIGSVYVMDLPVGQLKNKGYMFYEDDHIVGDHNTKAFFKKYKYEDATPCNEQICALLPSGVEAFDWDGDMRPHLSYEQSFWYLLHVRGFTKHNSSKVQKKGTFLGITEKISHLQELGVTTIEIQPVYEFEHKSPANYWGYTEGAYYAPKSSYGYTKDAGEEFCQMVKALHKAGMEVILQFMFPKTYLQGDILSVLRYWALVYHVDGFHVMGESIPLKEITQDPFLSDCKIVSDQMEDCFPALNYYGKLPEKRLGLYRDHYLFALRRFLKGDENMIPTALKFMRYTPLGAGNINYLSSYQGFTLCDLYSYDYKHNEKNGENNHDGSDCTYSWNCGEEGPSRKKKVLTLRKTQMMNALTLLFLSSGTPLLFMGDEFANSQDGNNNPYNQDNSTTWLNWKDLDKNQDIFRHIIAVQKLRKQYSILSPKKEFTMMDNLSCGYPDVSYHGTNAWQIPGESYARHVGVLFNQKYADDTQAKKEVGESLLYVGINMHWEKQSLALPRPPKGYHWEYMNALVTDSNHGSLSLAENSVIVDPRSIIFLSTVKDCSKKHGKALETL